MSLLREWIRRLAGTFRGGRSDSDLQEELRVHSQLATEAAQPVSEPGEAATRVSAIRHGGMTQALEAQRDQRGLPWLADMNRDVRHALRVFRRRPGFAIVAVVVLALGLGANVAVFSAVRAVLIDDLPYTEPDRLVSVWRKDSEYRHFLLSAAGFESLGVHDSILASRGACTLGQVVLRTPTGMAQINAGLVSPGLFEVFGVSPAAGRTLNASDFAPGVRSVVVSSAVWRTQFASAPDLVGRTIQLDRNSWTVVGIMPAGFSACDFDALGTNQTVWTPLPWSDAARMSDDSRYVFGRLAAGIEFEQASARLAGSGAPGTGSPSQTFRYEIEPLNGAGAAAARPGLLLLQGVACFLLLIACANLANLFLAHATQRRREMGVRAALGAGRVRIVRQLLTEAVVIATCGSLLGVAIAYVGVPLMMENALWTLPRGTRVAVAWPELGVAVAVGWLTALAFGIGPAFITTRAGLVDALRATTQMTAGPIMRLFRGGLVASQVLLALVVLTGAGLLLRSFVNVVMLPMGFDPRGLVVAEIPIWTESYASDSDRRAFARRLGDELQVHFAPGTWALGNSMPYTSKQMGAFTVVPRVDGETTARATVPFNTVSPSYFQAVGVPLLGGRSFQSGDADGAAFVAIVNQQFVHQFGGGGGLLGREIRSPQGRFTIVGVAGDTRNFLLTAPSQAAVYLPIGQGRFFQLSVAVRARDVAAATRTLREIVSRLDPDLPLVRAESVETKMYRSETQRHFYLYMLSLFAGLSGLLTAVGIYGVTAHVTALRVREMGIRLALGARPAQLKILVLRQGLLPILIGIAGGVVGALVVTRLLEANAAFTSQLFQITPHDPWTFALVTSVLLAVAAGACWIPARRSTRANPVDVLRAE